MTRYYCTVFDKNYLAKGIAMIQSLTRHSSNAVIYVLAMDIESHAVLRGLDLRHVAVLSNETFERETGIWKLKVSRTHQEYCWTVGSCFTEYVSGIAQGITYVDADCFFFSDPEVVFDEIGDKSIGITPHRFAKADEARLLPNGKYAVQWVTFKGEVGRKCLSKWAANVRRLCSYSHAEGQFADQKYLDSWPTDYPGEVCEIANPGVGLAPWNVENWHLEKVGDMILVGMFQYGQPMGRLCMYHFHEYIHGGRLTNWPLSDNAKEFIYAPYIKAIEEAQALINETVHLRA